MRYPVRVDDLPELRRRVVTPVVGSLLREGELEHLVVSFDAPPGDWPSPPEPGSVWLRLSAVGEVFEHRLVPGAEERGDGAAGVQDAQDLADELYGQLWDWLVETRFSGRERRYGDYEVPGPSDGASAPDG